MWNRMWNKLSLASVVAPVWRHGQYLSPKPMAVALGPRSNCASPKRMPHERLRATSVAAPQLSGCGKRRWNMHTRHIPPTRVSSVSQRVTSHTSHPACGAPFVVLSTHTSPHHGRVTYPARTHTTCRVRHARTPCRPTLLLLSTRPETQLGARHVGGDV